VKERPEDERPVLVYDAKDAEMPSWLCVQFDDGHVVPVRQMPVTDVPA
jgi:hypothetical protein